MGPSRVKSVVNHLVILNLVALEFLKNMDSGGPFHLECLPWKRSDHILFPIAVLNVLFRVLMTKLASLTCQLRVGEEKI